MPLLLKPVVQLDRTGCAIASVAVLARQPYRAVKAEAVRLGIAVTDPALWSDTAFMRRLLERYRLRSGLQRPFRTWEALPDLSLIAIKWHLEPSGPAWHWTVFARRHGRACVFDSKRGLATHLRTDFGRMRPRWYIPVAEDGP